MKRVHRFEVRPLAAAGDPSAASVLREAQRLGLAPARVRTARVYLIAADLDHTQAARLLHDLLVDPVIESGTIGTTPAPAAASLIEVHPLPGVMDPAAQSLAAAIRSLLDIDAEVATGTRYEFEGLDASQASTIARLSLANSVVHAIHADPYHPAHFPQGRTTSFEVRHVAFRDLDDAALERLSRDAHLFLSLDEMRAIRDEYRDLKREPTDIELETLAQTWSEHCVHKTLKATIKYSSTPTQTPTPSPGIPIPGLDDQSLSRPGTTHHPDGSVTIHNLLKSTVAAATHELIAQGLDWTLSVFVDNAGIIAFDDDHAVCVKVETHNHPSAIEPYGGAATGIGGCIRDIIGTGLAAKPIASTDVFCVATPGITDIPAGCLHPHRVLANVVAGVRDYGNRMGIPTLNGAVWFDDRHIGNPLVFCGCVGIMPRDKTQGSAKPGDLIVALGGRTGRDGIHGATFSSAELTDSHADEFAHAVQIGNAIEEKRVLDAILRARDDDAGTLYSAITDCGAGGFSSAVGEMGERIGAEVHLDRAPLKYAGLSYTEIWISEAQERMVLAVPPSNLDQIQTICDEEHVELAVLGSFGTPGADLILRYHNTEVGRLPMHFLHNGIPTPTREATWTPKRGLSASAGFSKPQRDASASAGSITNTLLALLQHPNVASKQWIIRQYDHEVQGNTVVRPLGGPEGIGPMDAAVIEPVPGTRRGLAIACGLATHFEADPYLMALAAIDECVRNLVCVGADPSRIAILDNFCWPSCKKPENLGSLVRAATGCYDGAMAYRTPFISGKDSLNNQFTTDDGRTIEIPPTLLITGIGIVPDIARCVTMDAKHTGNMLVFVEPLGIDATPTPQGYQRNLSRLGSSHYARLFNLPEGATIDLPRWNPAACAALAHGIASVLREGIAISAHDVSDGGALCALAEMLIAGSTTSRPLGFDLDFGLYTGAQAIGYWFGERPGGYILETPNPAALLARLAERAGHPLAANIIGRGINTSGALTLRGTPSGRDEIVAIADLAAAWQHPTL